MLVELAAANAAFAVIKECLHNGGELASVAQQLGSYFTSKSAISKKAASKGSDSDEFWALESIRVQEEELKQMMIYQGRAGLWSDWLAFQVAKKREREAAEKALRVRAQKRKQILYDATVVVLVALAGASLIGAILLIVYVAMKGKP